MDKKEIERLRDEGKKFSLSLSYGKDSIACIEAIKQLGYPLDRIVHVEVWATDTIPAELPDMIEFKEKADKIIFERYGINVERCTAMSNGQTITYEKCFHKVHKRGKKQGKIQGFPYLRGAWCNYQLKTNVVNKIHSKEYINYIGIASDEHARIERHIKKENIILPLVDIGWTESYCYEWCKNNDLLSPVYMTCARGVLVLSQSANTVFKKYKRKLSSSMGVTSEMG